MAKRTKVLVDPQQELRDQIAPLMVESRALFDQHQQHFVSDPLKVRFSESANNIRTLTQRCQLTQQVVTEFAGIVGRIRQSCARIP